MPGETRVLRVCCLNSELSVVVAPPVAGALGVIGFSGKTSLISDNLCLLKLSLSLTVGEMFDAWEIAERLLENQSIFLLVYAVYGN